MPFEVIMPQMGESIFEGTITRWLKKPGETVQRDEALFEISTDKVDAEIPSPAAGVLSRVLVPEGETVQINTVVAEIEEEGAVAAQPALCWATGFAGRGAVGRLRHSLRRAGAIWDTCRFLSRAMSIMAPIPFSPMSLSKTPCTERLSCFSPYSGRRPRSMFIKLCISSFEILRSSSSASRPSRISPHTRRLIPVHASAMLFLPLFRSCAHFSICEHRFEGG